MRAQSSVMVLSVVVVVLALVSGCSPDEPDVVAVVPEPPAPAPEFEPGAPVDQLNPVREGPAGPAFGPGVQVALNGISARSATSGQSLSEELPQTPLRLVFECTDGVTFAVRMLRNGLVLYPPGYPPNGSLTSRRCRAPPVCTTEPATSISSARAIVATLEMGRERYVDCVANPAAAVWQETLPRITTPR